jgi:hypothetical protein
MRQPINPAPLPDTARVCFHLSQFAGYLCRKEEIDIYYKIYNARCSENVLPSVPRLGVYLPCITS